MVEVEDRIITQVVEEQDEVEVVETGEKVMLHDLQQHRTEQQIREVVEVEDQGLQTQSFERLVDLEFVSWHTKQIEQIEYLHLLQEEQLQQVEDIQYIPLLLPVHLLAFYLNL